MAFYSRREHYVEKGTHDLQDGVLVACVDRAAFRTPGEAEYQALVRSSAKTGARQLNVPYIYRPTAEEAQAAADRLVLDMALGHDCEKRKCGRWELVEEGRLPAER
jgi:hypothetical protein